MFTLTIDTDNDAFADDPQAEIARILRKVARRVACGEDTGRCMDANGNGVGGYEHRQEVRRQ